MVNVGGGAARWRFAPVWRYFSLIESSLDCMAASWARNSSMELSCCSAAGSSAVALAPEKGTNMVIAVDMAFWNSSMLRRVCSCMTPLIAANGPQRSGAERIGHRLADLFLIGDKGVDGVLQIAGHDRLHGIVIEADQLAQHRDRQRLVPRLSCSKMICVSTERVRSSPDLAS
jgi:hypothetical protein